MLFKLLGRFAIESTHDVRPLFRRKRESHRFPLGKEQNSRQIIPQNAIFELPCFNAITPRRSSLKRTLLPTATVRTDDGENRLQSRRGRRMRALANGLVRACILAIPLLSAGLLDAQEYNFRYFGIPDGLNNLAVRSVYQDQVGFIWVNTEGGLYRFDGDRFQPFGAEQGIPPILNTAFGDAPDGSLLVGGKFGLFRLSGNHFEKISGPFKTVDWVQGIQSDGHGHTYLATDIGLVELSTEPGRAEFAQNLIPRPPGASGAGAYSVLLDGKTIWYGCGGEICHIDDHGTSVLGLESGLPDQEWEAILKDRDGNMWVRGNEVGILERPAGQKLFKKPDSPLVATALSGIPTLDSDGRVMLTSPNGLLVSTPFGWHKIDRTAGLRGTVYSVFEDRQHSLWIGLAGRGLAQWRGHGQWETYSADTGLGSDVVYEILPRPDGSVLTATEAGIYRGVRRGFGYEWSQLAPLANFPLHSLQIGPEGDLWVGTQRRGVARVQLGSGAVEWFGQDKGLAETAAYSIRFDSEHRLWAATEAGLFVAQPPYKEFSRIAGLPQTRFWSVVQGADGVIWAGGDAGLFEFDGGRWRTWTHANGLSNQAVLSLGAAPDGVIWVGYRFGGGIDRIHPTPNGISIEKSVQRPGTTGIVYFLDFDSEGHLWAGTDRGIDVWNGSRWSHYDVSDGLAWDDCDLNSFAQDPTTGAYWIGTSGGLSHFTPRPHATINIPAQVVFTRVLMGQTDISALHNPSFGIDSDSLTTQFSALNLGGQNEVVFRYRLSPDNAWTETTQHELQFVGLAPGNYRFEVEAGDGLGAWSGHPAEYAFTILAPWFRTWWFIVLCVIAPLLVILAVLRWRVVLARARERQLVRLVREKTADLERANAELVRLSSTDSLTGLANRRLFDQTLAHECAHVRRSTKPLSLIIFDVDHFKALNDSLGHQRGDVCLALLAGEMNRIARRSLDLAARIGGEEFAMILPNTGIEGARQVAEKVRVSFAALNVPHPASPIASILTVSAGVASTSDEQSSPEGLIAAADRALYIAKHQGRNRVITAPSESVENAGATL
jgi:diguanylate cyclase (GGDEF)-like protein